MGTGSGSLCDAALPSYPAAAPVPAWRPPQPRSPAQTNSKQDGKLAVTTQAGWAAKGTGAGRTTQAGAHGRSAASHWYIKGCSRVVHSPGGRRSSWSRAGPPAQTPSAASCASKGSTAKHSVGLGTERWTLGLHPACNHKLACEALQSMVIASIPALGRHRHTAPQPNHSPTCTAHRGVSPQTPQSAQTPGTGPQWAWSAGPAAPTGQQRWEDKLCDAIRKWV